ncbi:TPA: hypothetical protein ACS7XF_001860 [Providencia alcalifaciens]
MKQKIIMLPLPESLMTKPERVIGYVNSSLSRLAYLTALIVSFAISGFLFQFLYEMPLISIIFLPLLFLFYLLIKYMLDVVGYFEVDDVGLRYCFGKTGHLVDIKWDSIKNNSKVSVEFGTRAIQDKLKFSYWNEYGLTKCSIPLSRLTVEESCLFISNRKSILRTIIKYLARIEGMEFSSSVFSEIGLNPYTFEVDTKMKLQDRIFVFVSLCIFIGVVGGVYYFIGSVLSVMISVVVGILVIMVITYFWSKKDPLRNAIIKYKFPRKKL